jgi:hypothetical protein
MFCMRCGQEVPTAAEFCPACGQSTKLPEPQAAQATNYGAVPPPPQAQQPGYPPASYGAAPSNLKGVGGLLLVFCIFLTIVWPLWTLTQFVLRPGMFRAINALGLLRMAFGIAVGVSLWMQSRSAILLLRIYFVIAVVLTAWGMVSFATLMMRYSTWRFLMFAQWLTAVLPYMLFLVLGIVYFTKSERVRATYGENLL